MATQTTYYNLTKPSQNDKVNIGALNDNADKIDTALHNKVDSDDLTANNVMMSDGVTSVDDALDAIMPRTASGTTLSTLNSAVGQLSETQKLNCIIVVNTTTFNSITLKKGLEDYYVCVHPSNGGSILTFMYNGSNLIMRTSTGTSKTDDTLSLTSWSLYYQGTPI